MRFPPPVKEVMRLNLGWGVSVSGLFHVQSVISYIYIKSWLDILVWTLTLRSSLWNPSPSFFTQARNNKQFYSQPDFSANDNTNCMSFYSQQIFYIVTSDDPKWCKASFASIKRNMIYPADSDIIIKGSNSSEKVNARDFDLAISSLCNHTIYDYGTFGFWGAYLAGGRTILAHKMNEKKQHRQVKHIKIANIRGWEYLDSFVDWKYSLFFAKYHVMSNLGIAQYWVGCTQYQLIFILYQQPMHQKQRNGRFVGWLLRRSIIVSEFKKKWPKIVNFTLCQNRFVS